MDELKAWDSERYGALGDSDDGQSYDIFTQAAEVIRADSATLLGGLTPRTVIGMGDSQSAFRVDTYVNAIQPVSHAFNGFIAIGRSVLAAPIGSGLVGFSPFPAYVRTDNTTPFIQLNTEGDIEELGAALVRQPDNAYLRTWELAGAAHIDLHEGLYEGNTIEREEPTVTAPKCVFGQVVNGATAPDSMGVYEVYLPSQQSLSPGQLLSTLESIFTALETGAITNTTLRDEGLCLLEGYDTPFGTARLRALYPTHGDYVAQFTAAAASDLASGFLTQSDYDAAVAAAQAAPVP